MLLHHPSLNQSSDVESVFTVASDQRTDREGGVRGGHGDTEGLRTNGGTIVKEISVTMGEKMTDAFTSGLLL